MATIDDLLKLMIDQQASDLHLSAGAPPYMRIDGVLVPLQYRELTGQEVQSLMFEILSEKQKSQFIDKWELDFAYTAPEVARFRVNLFMQKRGLGAVFRLVAEKIKTLEELGLPRVLQDIVDVDKGLVLVTGPTGSGKSTTLAAMVHHINTNRESHIITIEDPIEYIHKNIKALINQREVGAHTRSFANALRSALREDPNILMVGELRDLETISLAVTAAETGHLVLATLHTNNAVKTIDRMIDLYPEGQQQQIRSMLAETLRAVIAQGLFRRADGQGRLAVLEILRNTKAVSNLIREGKTHQVTSVMQTSANLGMITFEKALEETIRKGKISRQDVASFLGKDLDLDPRKTG